jgi:hypothetical protein
MPEDAQICACALASRHDFALLGNRQSGNVGGSRWRNQAAGDLLLKLGDAVVADD